VFELPPSMLDPESFMVTDWRPIALVVGLAAAVYALVRGLRNAGGGESDELELELEHVPVDSYAPHDPATGCDPTVKPGVRLFREWAIAKWGQREQPPSPENILRGCDDKPDEHQVGRAWDLMTRSLEHGQSIVDALLAADPVSSEPHALARRAGVMYLIWNRQMWRAYPWQGKPAGSWGPYSGASPHTDHVHFSFSQEGAAGATSLYDALREELQAA
jgi:hypothetical protein